MLARQCIILALGLWASCALAQDDTLSWLLREHASTAPATAPAAMPASRPSPLMKPIGDAAIWGTITLSDGAQLAGHIHTTPGKPLRVWVPEKHEYADIALGEIAEIRATVLWERDEREWHFIASGSDVKEYTGRTYPARETQHTLILRDGREIRGALVAPIYVQTSEGERKLVLNKRAKGEMGQTLAQLIYVQRITLSASSKP